MDDITLMTTQQTASIISLNTKAVNKFRAEYTDGSDAAVADIPTEIRVEGSNAWVARLTGELMESFPDAHHDDIEYTLRGVIQELADAGCL